MRFLAVTIYGLAKKARLLPLGVVLTLAVAACGSSSGGGSAGSAAAATCTGDPVKIMTITTLSGPIANFAPLPAGAKAAAKAVTASCELGRPVQIISCDDQFSPNGATACARRAVEEKVVALGFSFDQTGDAYMPIFNKTGIPTFNSGTSADENTLTSSYPVSLPIPDYIAHVSSLAALGSKKIAIVNIDLPAVGFTTNFMKQQIKKLGLSLAAQIPLPPTATDMTQFAGQVISSGADGVVIATGPAQDAALLKAMEQQGADLNKIHVIQGSATVTAANIKDLPDNGDGLYLVGTEWPTSDTTNPGVGQFRKEMAAAGTDTADLLGDLSLTSWSMVHVITDALKGGPYTSAALLAKVRTMSINRPEMTPFDFTKNAFPSDPVLSKLRLFSSKAVLSRIKNGKIVPISDGFFDVTTMPTLKS
jgi:ABC-type branched-subunit amino acid transport system substrate-binding protein